MTAETPQGFEALITATITAAVNKAFAAASKPERERILTDTAASLAKQLGEAVGYCEAAEAARDAALTALKSAEQRLAGEVSKREAQDARHAAERATAQEQVASLKAEIAAIPRPTGDHALLKALAALTAEITALKNRPIPDFEFFPERTNGVTTKVTAKAKRGN